MSLVRAIRAATRAEAAGLAARLDDAAGYPRCERLAGGLTLVGSGRHAGTNPATGRPTCPCTDATAPHAACPHATRREAAPLPLRAGGFALPVGAAKPALDATLTSGERSRIELVPDGELA